MPMPAPRRTPCGTRLARAGILRGGILLELLLSIALFVGAAVLVLDAMGSALDGARRADLRARAMDLAQSRLAELDAGLVAIGDLGGDESERSDARGESADLAVSLEVAAAPGAPDAMVARATVRTRGADVVGEGTIVVVAERVVTLRSERRSAGGAR
jgi:type II secretory pathway pseudopilin PulG